VTFAFIRIIITIDYNSKDY